MKVYLLAIVVSALLMAPAPGDGAMRKKRQPSPAASIASAITQIVNGIVAANPSSVGQSIAKLVGDIGTLVSDAINYNYAAFGTDVDNIVCDSLAVGGITNCNLADVSVAISTLVNDAEDEEPATTIVTDAFNVAIAAVTDAAEMSNMPSALTNSIVKLLNAISSLVNDAINCGAAMSASPAMGWASTPCVDVGLVDIPAVVADGIAIGTAAKSLSG
jgi:hypothetical protein